MRPWSIEECEAYAQQLRDKNRACTAEHAAQAIEYLLGLVKPEQEPFAEVRLNMTGGNAGLSTHIVQLAEGYYPAGTKLYTTPPHRDKEPTKIFGPNLEELLNSAGFYRKKEWKGLTEEEVENFVSALWPVGVGAGKLLRAIEAKLKEKNA